MFSLLNSATTWKSVQGLYIVQNKGQAEILKLMRPFLPLRGESPCLSADALKTNICNAQSLQCNEMLKHLNYAESAVITSEVCAC